MKKSLLVLALAAAFPAYGQGVVVPQLDKTASVAPVAYAMETPTQQLQLTQKEEESLRLIREWRNSNRDKPRRQEDGTLVFLYGVTQPTLICSALQSCLIRLQAGEVVNNVHIGDTARWKIGQAIVGRGASEAEIVIVKPHDAGISTNVIIATDRRIYTIGLKSAKHEVNAMPGIAFDYADDLAGAWANHKAREAKAVHASTLRTGENVASLDFGYTITGDNPTWKPVRVYRGEGGKTYIQFASAGFIGGEAPLLVIMKKEGGFMSDPVQEMVNHRLIGDRYVVDGLPPKMALVMGVGKDEQRVIIEYTGGKPQ